MADVSDELDSKSLDADPGRPAQERGGARRSRSACSAPCRTRRSASMDRSSTRTSSWPGRAPDHGLAAFVPDYEKWLDNTYAKQWGERTTSRSRSTTSTTRSSTGTAASQVAGKSGHDLFWFISPPSTFQKQVVPVNDLVQEVTKKFGPMTRVARRSTYNPKTKQYFGFPETYAPDPVQYRRSYLEEAGVSLRHGTTCAGGRQAEAAGPPGRPRDVERDRLEHAADVASLLLRRLHPERGRTES